MTFGERLAAGFGIASEAEDNGQMSRSVTTYTGVEELPDPALHFDFDVEESNVDDDDEDVIPRRHGRRRRYAVA